MAFGTLIRVVPPLDLAYLSAESGEVFSFAFSWLAVKPSKALGLKVEFWTEGNVVVKVRAQVKPAMAMAAGAAS